MTNPPQCTRCRTPVTDNAYICPRCTNPARRLLQGLRGAAGEIVTTVARLDRLGTHGRRTDPFTPEPANLAAKAAHQLAETNLLSVHRHIADHSGHTPRWEPGVHYLVSIAAYLEAELDWIRKQPDADDLLYDLEDACAAVVRIVDRPADRWYAGTCDMCTSQLRPPARAKTYACPECGAVHDLAARKTQMLEQIEEQWLSAARAATALTALGVPCTAAMIRGYAARNRLMPHPDRDESDYPRYRIGSIRELLAEQTIARLQAKHRRAQREAEEAEEAEATL